MPSRLYFVPRTPWVAYGLYDAGGLVVKANFKNLEVHLSGRNINGNFLAYLAPHESLR
jgi:hypothetical protein